MKFDPIHVENYINVTEDFEVIHDVIKVGKETKIFSTEFLGPFYSNKNTQIGPNAKVGKYSGFNESCFFARGEIGAFCAIGARTSINPFNHPVDWLSISEFQYHPRSFDWVEEYNAVERLERTPDMFEYTRIGNDVWMGHNVNVLPGISVGDGAIIGAGSVVTKDVPPYAIVAGVPAKVIRFRFDEAVIERLLKVRWWEFDLQSLSGLPYRDVLRCLDELERLREEINSRNI